MIPKKVYDLAQPYYVGMPHHPAHPPFLRSLNKLHGEYVLSNGASSASETLTLGGHVGTHIDGFGHFSCGGKMFGGVVPTQSYASGVHEHSIDAVAPIFRPGVLFDVAGLLGADALPVDFVITPEHLEACKVEPAPGSIALVRTGWARFWDDAKRFITGGKGSQPAGPGPKEPAARWLSDRGIFAAGSDTVAFEYVPSHMEVHVHLLVEKGIHIIECLNLEELARDKVTQFTFVALPLKIQGGTGSPVRPVAVC
ncbi:MAG TPA: cyclase family protein [Bryobacteraceae bacterium]|nr:cyclase family protein [Bryobacteraceae bacterium]